MTDRHDIELRNYELAEARAEDEYQRKLQIFRHDPYSYCEWNIDAFGKYDLLSIALEYLLCDFDPAAAVAYGSGNQCARKDLLAAIRDSVEKMEL